MAKKLIIPELDLKIIERNVAVPKIRFSASKLKTIKDCYGKYFYRNIAEIKVPEKTWPATVYGLVCHGILEESLLERQAGQKEKDIFNKFTEKGLFEKRFKETVATEKERGRIFGKPRSYNEDDFMVAGEEGLRVLLKFVLGYFKNFTKLLPEEKLESDWQWDTEIFLNGIADLPVFFEEAIYRIFDFKTTQHSENFYYVNWKEDIQSLMYLYMSYKKFGIWPQGFDYLVFNWKENNIFLNSVTHPIAPKNDEELAHFFDGLNKILTSAKIMHRKPKTSYYFPEKEKCHWCEFAPKNGGPCTEAIRE